MVKVVGEFAGGGGFADAASGGQEEHFAFSYAVGFAGEVACPWVGVALDVGVAGEEFFFEVFGVEDAVGAVCFGVPYRVDDVFGMALEQAFVRVFQG